LTLNGSDRPGWTRTDCERFLEASVPHRVYSSACIHCPYHDNETWRQVLAMPASGQRLIQIDTALRTPGVIVNRNLDNKLFLHRSCRPIDKTDLADSPTLGFAMECEGGCGL
jgi:hypothetical protein